jgi:hypothetical protein
MEISHHSQVTVHIPIPAEAMELGLAFPVRLWLDQVAVCDFWRGRPSQEETKARP